MIFGIVENFLRSSYLEEVDSCAYCNHHHSHIVSKLVVFCTLKDGKKIPHFTSD